MRVYFFCLPAGPPAAAKYQHSLVCLAEGLRELGIEYWASCDYWREHADRPGYLLPLNSGISPEDCDVVVLESSYMQAQGCPDIVRRRRRHPRVVLIDNSDGIRTLSAERSCRLFDLVLRTHSNRAVVYRYGNVRPWAFGLSQRMLDAVEAIPAWRERRRALLAAYGCAHPIRVRAQSAVFPKLKEFLAIDEERDSVPPTDAYGQLMWEQTGRRHYPQYYDRLKTSVACAAFGGMMSPAWEWEPKWLRRSWKRYREGYANRILTQWDSWRLWEAMAAGCVAFHVDFEKHGLELPAEPTNWEHYIGVDLEQVDEAAERITEQPSLLEKISLQGRTWAREQYGPTAVAQRFLHLIQGE